MVKIVKYNWLFNNSTCIKYLKSIEVKDKDKDKNTIKKNENKLFNPKLIDPKSIEFELDYKTKDSKASVNIQNSNTPGGTIVSANCLFRCCSKKPIIGFRRLSFSIELNQPDNQYWGPNWNIYLLSRKNSSKGYDRPFKTNYFDANGGGKNNFGCEWDMVENNGQVFSVSTLHTNDNLWENNYQKNMDYDSGKNYYFPQGPTTIPENTWSRTRKSSIYNPIKSDNFNPKKNYGITTFEKLTKHMDFTLTVFPTSEDKLDLRLALKQNQSDKCIIILDTRDESDLNYFPRNGYNIKEKMKNVDNFRKLAKQMIDDVGLWVMLGCSNNYIPGRYNKSDTSYMDPYPEGYEIVKTMGDFSVRYSNWIYT